MKHAPFWETEYWDADWPAMIHGVVAAPATKNARRTTLAALTLRLITSNRRPTTQL